MTTRAMIARDCRTPNSLLSRSPRRLINLCWLLLLALLPPAASQAENTKTLTPASQAISQSESKTANPSAPHQALTPELATNTGLQEIDHQGIHSIGDANVTGNKPSTDLFDASHQLTAPPTSPPAVASLPHNLSPWGMFMAADWVVKAVMIGLAIASLLTWTVLVSKSVELTALKRRLKRNLSNINTAHTLADAADATAIEGVGREFIRAATDELQLSADLSAQAGGRDGIKERVASSLSRIEVSAARSMMLGTGFLATVGAIGPFVGLFGTVWGIMNSFIGISQANTTNLAVVAPGIAEALLATAFGLVAAIPAVVIYNHFTRQISGAKCLVSDSAAAVIRLVSRDLDRGIMAHSDSSALNTRT